jgi:transcriptional regulator with XRE-family HTH domain
VKDIENLKELGRRIRRLRKEVGLTQEQLADEAELDRSYIGGIERGERNITFSVLCQIAKALHVEISDFTSGLPVDVQ